MEAILQVQNVTKQYPNFKLNNVSFSIPKGTIMGLIGQNGAGKSTLIKAILDLIKKDNGNVLFLGKELSSDSFELKEDIGVVFDDINFFETLSPDKIGKISKNLYSRWDEKLYYEYLQKFQLPVKNSIKTFSKGMKMKLSIAVALSHSPKFLILDESTSGLDPVMRDDILDIFLKFVQNKEHSIFMSSHITSDLEKVADYITFIHNGEIIFSKMKNELKHNYGIIHCDIDIFNTIDKSEIIKYRRDNHQYNILVEDKENIKQKYKNIIIDDASIDDILLFYIKGEMIK